MSSMPFSLGLPVIDNPNENSPKEFVLRCKNEDDYYKKKSNFLKCISSHYTVLCYRIGYRPDKPVPVARLFYEIKIKKYDPLNYILTFWTHAYTGRKAQPHVMTPEEVERVEEQGIVWCEYKKTNRIISLMRIVNIFEAWDDYVLLCEVTDCDDYLKEYRFWNSQPTNAQRNATPWEPMKEE